jgi:hypothetical protein
MRAARRTLTICMIRYCLAELLALRLGLNHYPHRHHSARRPRPSLLLMTSLALSPPAQRTNPPSPFPSFSPFHLIIIVTRAITRTIRTNPRALPQALLHSPPSIPVPPPSPRIPLRPMQSHVLEHHTEIICVLAGCRRFAVGDQRRNYALEEWLHDEQGGADDCCVDFDGGPDEDVSARFYQV